MGRLFLEHHNGRKIISCIRCGTYISSTDQIMSTQFTGSTGEAALFKKAYNYKEGEVELREMTSGKHYVRDVKCKKCNHKLGWMYEFAVDPKFDYKEARVILENNLTSRSQGIQDPHIQESSWNRRSRSHRSNESLDSSNC
uniref:Protein yippee-like n=1 Tax=Rhabditophanes sp. KR3021 TaxID=114890 RepID=A0AC35U8K2_9BILA